LREYSRYSPLLSFRIMVPRLKTLLPKTCKPPAAAAACA